MTTVSVSITVDPAPPSSAFSSTVTGAGGLKLAPTQTRTLSCPAVNSAAAGEVQNSIAKHCSTQFGADRASPAGKATTLRLLKVTPWSEYWRLTVVPAG